SPSTSASPRVGRDWPTRMRKSEVLPAPEGPSRPTTPERALIERSLSAATVPYHLDTPRSWMVGAGSRSLIRLARRIVRNAEPVPATERARHAVAGRAAAQLAAECAIAAHAARAIRIAAADLGPDVVVAHRSAPGQIEQGGRGRRAAEHRIVGRAERGLC